MTKLLIDELCEKIFMTLLVSDKKIRFNKLYQALNNIGLKISRPTLIKHLNHLKKRKLIIRKQEGKQKVTYQANWEKLKHLTEITQDQKIVKIMLENKKNFQSLPIEDQTVIIQNILTLRNLHLLKVEIIGIIDPKKSFEPAITHLFISQLFNIFEKWLLRNYRNNQLECKEKALPLVEYNIERYKNMLFEKINLPSDKDLPK